MLINQKNTAREPATENDVSVWNYKQDEPGSIETTSINPDLAIKPGLSMSETTVPEEAILCAFCRNGITTLRQKITVHGSHEHTFVNPSGHIYRLGCYQDATGCMQRGGPTTEYSWFRGYAWNYALCKQCFSHLGWVFHGGSGGSFFGLITDKLIFF